MEPMKSLDPVYSTCTWCGEKIYRYTNPKAFSTVIWYHLDTGMSYGKGNKHTAEPLNLEDYLKQL